MSAKVAAKLIEVARAIKGDVKATGWNDFHKYQYLSESDIVEAVRDAMTDKGLLVLPGIESISDEEVTDRKGNRAAITTVVFAYTILDAESGESIMLKWAGRGDDPADKGLYKAMTGALKYLLRQTFLIADSKSDPEADRSTDERAAERTSKPKCPSCGLPLRSNDEGFYCWRKKGGCGWAGSSPAEGATEAPTDAKGAPADPARVLKDKFKDLAARYPENLSYLTAPGVKADGLRLAFASKYHGSPLTSLKGLTADQYQAIVQRIESEFGS